MLHGGNVGTSANIALQIILYKLYNITVLKKIFKNKKYRQKAKNL